MPIICNSGLTWREFERRRGRGKKRVHEYEVDHTNGKGWRGDVVVQCLEVVTREENARRAAVRRRARAA